MNRAKFFDALRGGPLYRRGLTEKQVAGISGILDAFETHGDGSIKTLAYALATAYHEVGANMMPVREGFARTDAGARRAVNALAKRRGPNSAVARYAKPYGPLKHVYYGRGHVQLTWIENYRRSSADAGVDLVKNPDAMLGPVTSARVLIRGLMDGRWNGKRKGIAHYLPPDGPDDLKGARRTVNITDKWEKIAEHYRVFLNALKEADFGTPSKTAPAKPTPPASDSLPEPDPVTVPKQGGLFGLIRLFFTLIANLFKGKST